MSLTKFTQFKGKGKAPKITVRFTRGVAYFSTGFVRAASAALIEAGFNDRGEEVKYVEFFCDKETGQIGVRPVGHKGLSRKVLMERDGMKSLAGSNTKSTSVVGFPEALNIADKTKLDLTQEVRQSPGLPEGEGQYIIFLSEANVFETEP